MKKQSMLIGAGVLSAGALVTRVLGALYRIPLTRILGALGTGMYQLVFPIYAFLIVLSTTGMPLAISRLISSANASGDVAKKRKIVRVSMWVMLGMGAVFAIILCLACRYIARLQGEGDVWLAYIAIAPSVIFVGVISVLRGYFQGEQIYTPTALSQIIEQVVKIVFGILLSLLLLPYGLMYAVVGAVLAVSASELVAAIYMYLMYRRSVRGSDESSTAHSGAVLSEMWRVACPILAGSLILPLANMVDSFIVVNLLNKHFASNVSTALYGIESGVVGAIINLPTVISFALASVILPVIGQATPEQRQQKLSRIITTNLCIVLPCIIGLVLFSPQIISLLYGSRLSAEGLDGYRMAVSMLSVSSVGVFYMSFAQVFSAVLQGLGRAKAALRNLSIAVLIKFALQIPLMLIPDVNIYGLIIANIVCYATVFYLDFGAIAHMITFQTRDVATILLGTLLVMTVVYMSTLLIAGVVGFAIGLLLGGGIYLYMMSSIGIIDVRGLIPRRIKHE